MGELARLSNLVVACGCSAACLLCLHAVHHAPMRLKAAQGRALLKKLDASKDEWGAIYAISRKPDADLKGTRVNFIALNLLDVEVRMHVIVNIHTAILLC
jgi:hypothetical protein